MVRGVVERGGAQRRWRPEPLAVDGTPAPALVQAASGTPSCGVRPRPRTWPSLAHGHVQPRRCIGRYEGTARCLGRRERPPWVSAIAVSMATAPPDVCGAARVICTGIGKRRQDTRPGADDAGPEKSGKTPNIHSEGELVS
jgi:hypothetical protein